MNFYFLDIFFKKNVFHAWFILIGSWKGGKNLRKVIILTKNLLGLGYRKQTISFKPYKFATRSPFNTWKFGGILDLMDKIRSKDTEQSYPLNISWKYV